MSAPGLETESPPAAAPAELGPSWQEQDGTLRDMWMQNETPADIAAALGRSVPAVMTRAARLGLPRRFAPGRKPGRHASEEGGARSSAAQARAQPEIIESAPQAAARICLMCLTKFQSQGRFNRICSSCKSSAEYESGSRLPELDYSVE